MVNEIITTWQSPGGGGGLTIMYADDEADMSAVRNSIAALWEEVETFVSEDTSYVIAPEGRTLDTGSGQLSGFWSEPTPHTGVGVAGTAVVANAAQVLFRWRTNTIVGGRLVQGRTYVPGLLTQHTSVGQLAPGAATDLGAAANAFATAASTIVVWHRPTSGTGGSVAPLVSGSVWAELAVLRDRRT